MTALPKQVFRCPVCHEWSTFVLRPCQDCTAWFFTWPRSERDSRLRIRALARMSEMEESAHMNVRCLFGHAWREVAFRSKEARREAWEPPLPGIPLPPEPFSTTAKHGHNHRFVGESFERCSRCGERRQQRKYEEVIIDRWATFGELPEGAEESAP